MKCYECKWLDRSVVLTSNPPKYRCTLGFGSHYADHECEYDFMPIVRCKECRWYDKGYGFACHNPRYGDGYANYPPPYVDEDYWCKDGEHKGGDTE